MGRPIEFRGTVRPSSRKAAPKPGGGGIQQAESSAHPGDPNFDQAYAQSLLGNLAESVRKFLAEKYDCRPPGLKTIVNPDGSMKVVGDCPEAAIGIEVTIGVLGQTSQGSPADMGTQDANQDMMGGQPIEADPSMGGMVDPAAGGMLPDPMAGTAPPVEPPAGGAPPVAPPAPGSGAPPQFGIGPV